MKFEKIEVKTIVYTVDDIVTVSGCGSDNPCMGDVPCMGNVGPPQWD